MKEGLLIHNEALPQSHDLTERRLQFIAGSGPDRLTTIVDGRTEVLHRHAPGFMEREVRVASIGAHPDDTALNEALEYSLVKQGRAQGFDSGLAVITATDGGKGVKPAGLTTNLGAVRVEEDISATRLLGSDLYINLGFSDGKVTQHCEDLSDRLSLYLTELDPMIIILPDPRDTVHSDHVAVSEIVLDVLRKNGQNPLVLFADFQNGIQELGDDAIGFLLEHEEYEIFRDAFLTHNTQTAILTPDIRRVLERPILHAESFYPGVPYLGVARQDLTFSQEPISSYLGESFVPVEKMYEVSENIVYSRRK